MPKLFKLFELDARSLSLMRIGLGVLLLLDIAERAGSLGYFYSDAGVWPAELVLFSYSPIWERWNPYFLLGSSGQLAGLFFFHALCAAALTCGWKTRVSTGLCWLLTLSLYHRAGIYISGGHLLLVLSLFWGLFLSWGSHFSVDARSSEKTVSRVSSVGSAGLLLQVSIMYFSSGYWKCNPRWLAEKSALQDILSVDAVTTNLGRTLAPHAGITEPLGLLTVALEVLAPVFLLCGNGRVRGLIFGLLMLFHLGIAATLSLGLFPFICIAVLVGLLPSLIWGDVEAENPKLHPIVSTLAAVFIVSQIVWVSTAIARGKPQPFSESNGAFETAYLTTMRALKMEQTWRLFSSPAKEDRWFLLEAELESGEHVDLLRQGQRFDFTRPEEIKDQFKTSFDRKHHSRLRYLATKKRTKLIVRFLEVRCAGWMAKNQDEQIRWARLWLMTSPNVKGVDSQETTLTHIHTIKLKP